MCSINPEYRLETDCNGEKSTLPVGQTFVWHRHQLAVPSIRGSPIWEVEERKAVVTSINTTAVTTSMKQESPAKNGLMGTSTSKMDTGRPIVKVEEEAMLAVRPEASSSILPGSPIIDVKQAPAPLPSMHLPQIKVEPTQETDDKEKLVELDIDTDQDIPREEYSRAIPNPSRAILLRQSETKIWFTSVLPPSTSGISEAKGKGTSGEADIREKDLEFILDYFQLPPNFDPPSFGSLARPLQFPLPLEEQYRTWARLDPLLFGKAWAAGALPRGVRVCRQEGWECLIA